jgi:hypothetical protein
VRSGVQDGASGVMSYGQGAQSDDERRRYKGTATAGAATEQKKNSLLPSATAMHH